MKIIDCITYFNEPILFKLRLHILDEFVDKFVVSEATYTHSGEKKKINFNINDYPKFKNKITHIVVDQEPKDLIKLDKNNSHYQQFQRINAVKRYEKQKDEIKVFLKTQNKNDWLIYSDSDEIPNLSTVNFSETKNKILLFKQQYFYYKFNLSLPSLNWYGSKACKIKDLNSISYLSNTKNKKYPWWRLDVLFNKNKYINLKIIDNGGWHFSMLKKPEDIFFKQKNDEHYDEFELSGIKTSDIQDMVENNYIIYDHNADKSEFNKKWNKKNRIYLAKINDSKLPKYLIENKKNYINWFA